MAGDLIEKAVELTKARLSFLGLTAEVGIEDAGSLSFKDESFDIVVSFRVIHHTPDTKSAV